ncbi:hypothetical protein B0H13DRAFT_2525883 [Mycena leptocephala]|nr:hypothetical protein B0H13DRAFT_2525883 [Mycena leptocephala]
MFMTLKGTWKLMQRPGFSLDWNSAWDVAWFIAPPVIGMFLTNFFICYLRLVQITTVLCGLDFFIWDSSGPSEEEYNICVWAAAGLTFIDIFVYLKSPWSRIPEGTILSSNDIRIGFTYPLVYHCVLSTIDFCFGEEFRHSVAQDMGLCSATSVLIALFSVGIAVTRAIEHFISCDSISPSEPSRWPADGSIGLSIHDDPVEMNDRHPSSWRPPPELGDSVLHWEMTFSKPLWMTVANERCEDIAHTVHDLLSSHPCTSIALVDVSQTRHTIWPLMKSLMGTSPEYRQEIENEPPRPFCIYFSKRPWVGGFYFTERPIWGGRFKPEPWEEANAYIDENIGTVIKRMIFTPMEHIKKKTAHRRAQMAPVVLIITGVQNIAQADELYRLIEVLNGLEVIRIVVITGPNLFRHVSARNEDLLQRAHTLYVSNGPNGPIVYSGKDYVPPTFDANIFSMLVECMHRIGGTKLEKVWNHLTEVGILCESPVQREYRNDGATPSTASIILELSKAWKFRRQMLEWLSRMQILPQFQINEGLVEDNVAIAEKLRQLFELNSYKTDIPSVPEEHVLAAMNLTNNMLEHGLPERSRLGDPDLVLHARHFLHWLAEYLKQLPDNVLISTVFLKTEHPVNYGGFSSIYLGHYKDSDGIRLDVALKVLKIFENQTQEGRVVLSRKFVKEVLVWHFLRHDCIVPFLGVLNSPSLPSVAMVSPWMPRGSVLKYMEEHSPHSPASFYAMNLLHDVIRGLEYLHSENVVHGDLCGRNILIDKDGRARLSDFGLASLIDSEMSKQSSARAGSARWMAPELVLLSPESPFKRTSASDVWAFGCVCCEIWSEGNVPFNHLSDSGLVLAMNRFSATGRQENRLWDLARWCFQYAPSERPNTEVLAAMISEMTKSPGAVQEVPTVAAASSSNSFERLLVHSAIGKGKKAS